MVMILLIPTGCSPDATDILNVDSEGNTSIDKEALENTINQGPAQELDEVEKEGILYMREEEKLARDAYSKLYEIWGINNFNNIGASEQTHMDAMESLIERYNLIDPAKGKGIGEFTNPELQQLYDELVEQGSKSEIDALKVGAAVEEIDIIDIEEYVAQTSKQDIVTVYENLLKGSRNHLRSFVSVMEKRGVTYKAQYLTDKQFNDIIAASVERGGG
jgi:hypothetical protein